MGDARMADVPGRDDKSDSRVASLFEMSVGLLVTILTAAFFAGVGLLYIGDDPETIAVVLIAVSGITLAFLVVYAGRQVLLAQSEAQKGALLAQSATEKGALLA